ncbi:MAG: hypothetical protein GY765_07390 [bacterium]|nr:hypothetical protein [bacterium]
MKPKKFNKKLSLKKFTVANLEEALQKEVAAGGFGAGTKSGITCLLCDTNVSCNVNRCIVGFTCFTNCDPVFN